LTWLDRCLALGLVSLDLDRRLGLLSARLDAFDP
jgi:hypothetical protein